MIELVWHDFLKIGVDFIDDDHKKLLKIMQDTKNAIEIDDRKLCIQLLSSLITEARGHFLREEKFLQEVKYPGLEEHKSYHKKLLIKADTTKKICEGFDTENDLKECFEGMAMFLIDDILRGDIKFKSYLEYEGLIKIH